MGHTAWAPEGREGRYQAGPKGRNLEDFYWDNISILDNSKLGSTQAMNGTDMLPGTLRPS